MSRLSPHPLRDVAFGCLLLLTGCSKAVTKPRSDDSSPASTVDLVASTTTLSSVTLGWTAPGDDGTVGTAGSYDLRYSTATITSANFGSATQVAGEPRPGVAGTAQAVVVSGLAASTTYYFALKTSDEVPNVSGLSNVANGTTLAPPSDTTPPAAVADLATTGSTTSSVTLQWTAPGDDAGVGTASAYDLRYSTSPIGPGTFDAATSATGEPTPATAGTVQGISVTGLVAGTTYYFALKTADEVPNVSAISNVATTVTLAPPVPLSAPQPYATGNSPRSVSIGDVNADAKPDLVTANFFGNSVSVLLGAGNGTFGAKTDYPAGASPFFATIGDLKADGIADIVATNFYDATVSVLFGNGSGAFNTVTALGLGGAPYSVAIGDFQNDGVPDMVATDGDNQRVAVFFGYSTGAFYTPPWNSTVGGDPASVVAPRLNGDAFSDIVAANISASSVSVVLSNGDDTFQPHQDYATGGSPWCVAVADVNNDGFKDIVTANSASNSVSVLLGTGTGTFGAKTDFGTGTDPRSVAIGDIDGDGSPDLVTANYTAGSISVLLGNGDGTFKPKTDITTRQWSNSVAIADLNGDGKLDVAVANYGDNSVSVLLNTGAPSARARAARSIVLRPQVRLRTVGVMRQPAAALPATVPLLQLH